MKHVIEQELSFYVLVFGTVSTSQPWAKFPLCHSASLLCFADDHGLFGINVCGLHLVNVAPEWWVFPVTHISCL